MSLNRLALTIPSEIEFWYLLQRRVPEQRQIAGLAVR